MKPITAKDTTEKIEVSEKPEPPLKNLSSWATLWLWGSLLLFAPIYLHITGKWQLPFNAFGVIAISVSFGGALRELGKQRKNEGFSYWGLSLVFLLPALILHLAVTYQYVTSPWDVIAKVATLILLAFGGPMLFIGLPYMFWKQKSPPDTSPEQLAEQKQAKRKADISTIVSVIIALLSLLTAVIKFVTDVGK